MTNLQDLTHEELESIDGGDFLPCDPWPTDPNRWLPRPYNPFPMPSPGCW
jgi:hypothetical protein